MTEQTNLPIAKEINVYIKDHTANVPGTDLKIYEYRSKVDRNYIPGDDFPSIKMEPLPKRTANLAEEAIMIAAKNGPNKKGLNGINGDVVIQASATKKSVDLREYPEKVYNYKTRQYEFVPEADRKPAEKAESLFLNTVRWCFEKHYGLALRPDTLMWLVLHEIGITVKQNAETYRHLFTTQKDKQNINVRLDSVSLNDFDQADQWAVGVRLLNEGLKDKMPSNLMQVLLPDFSTHDINSKTASYVAMLDAASPFYSYTITTCCGIPSIRPLGKGEDYDHIVTACETLSNVFSTHLGLYFKHLLPVLKEIANTATGRKQPDPKFWQSIYGHLGGSGQDDMTGWVTSLVNYIPDRSGQYISKSEDIYNVWPESKPAYAWHSGLALGHLPHHVSSVPFIWNYHGQAIDCRLMAGFLAIQDVDGYAVPTLSWAVVRGNKVEAIDNQDGTVTAIAEGQDPVTYQV